MKNKTSRAPVAPHMLNPEMLGIRLRTARKQRGWTLAQVAERSNVSITTISRAERGQLALGYENVAALAQALQLDMGTLFSHDYEQPPAEQGPVITRSGEGVAYRGLSFTYEFLATAAKGKPINPVLGTIHARRINSPEDFSRHAGVEFVYVISGRIEVHFETGEVAALDKGDSLYFDSRIGHAYICVSKQLAKVIGVITAESDQILLARQGHDLPGH
ncbi:helix-turn-helix domain-containing protein [Pseudomonas sessilinigenes]|uniref:XRE family transcriptional regulator n=1 Tax=Pseudomonas sessilinigenes TaxID=658629 RepID=A0ABX8MIB8_9PSED|nr:XRE family transcriptional regulator [Pseudomonas sessilinigenes]QXH37811.1 XRE family transcriptional regulator [Pseudomonas sessilinigenes]